MRVSVVIVTMNRKEELRKTINAYLAQDYPDKEVIVVDNMSSDGTREMMKTEFPDVRYLWLPDNFDIRAINIGVEMASGDIIWRTDSDSNPESNQAYRQAVEIFEKYDDIDIICTEDIVVIDKNRVNQWYTLPHDKQNIPEKGYMSYAFNGTGAAIRKRVFEKIGGFWEFGFEEIDFCTRAILAGFGVRYFPNIRTLHYATKSERNNSERWIRISNQLMRYNWKYFPYPNVLFRGIFIYFFQLFFGITQRVSFIAFCECSLSLITVSLRTIRNERRSVSYEQLKQITLGNSLVKSYLGFFVQKSKRLIRKIFKK